MEATPAAQAQQPQYNHTSPSLLCDYIDKTTLARELGRTIRTLDRLILRGDGPPKVQIGKRTLFRREAVLQWLRERETPIRPQSKGRQRGAR